MAHSSLPIFLDPPNWQQQSNQAPEANDHEDPRQIPAFLPAPAVHGAGAGSIRPGSMAYRARLAMIPQPEAALKCPRCDSTNTKFCYFNNYSLSQPRHFCKTCRRYWTRGGALRNVPVGGGFRKNKKKKKSSNRSKSPTATQAQMGNSRGSGGAIISNIENPTMGHFPRFGGGNSGLNFTGIHLNSGRQDHHQLDHHQWRPQQHPPFIVAGLEPPPPPGYPLNIIQTQVNNFGAGPNSSPSSASAAALQYCHQQLQNLTPFPRIPMKNEEQIQSQSQNQEQGIIMSNFLRPDHDHQNNHQLMWPCDHQNSWTDHHLSALSSSSSTHLL